MFGPPTDDDLAYLWREAQRYFRLAAQSADPAVVDRYSRFGCGFAAMAVALLRHMNMRGQPERTAGD